MESKPIHALYEGLSTKQFATGLSNGPKGESVGEKQDVYLPSIAQRTSVEPWMMDCSIVGTRKYAGEEHAHITGLAESITSCLDDRNDVSHERNTLELKVKAVF